MRNIQQGAVMRQYRNDDGTRDIGISFVKNWIKNDPNFSSG
jgi:hypothetical protein